MSQSIADAIKARRGERHKETKKEIKIYGRLRTKFDVSILLAMPDGFPDDKFVIEAFYGLYSGNSNNFSKSGDGKNSRYYGVIRGGGDYWYNNIFDLLQYYPEYDWLSILERYPRSVPSYEDAKNFLKELRLQVEYFASKMFSVFCFSFVFLAFFF